MLIDTKHAYLAALIFSSVLAWASFFSIIFFTNPQSAGILGVVILYIGLTVGLVGLFIILCQVVKIRRSRNLEKFSILRMATRRVEKY